MHTKLAGGPLPLSDMISKVLDENRTKLAAADDKAKKPLPFQKKDEKDTEKEEAKEKKSSAGVVTDADEISKLASALEYVGDTLVKEAADQQNLGGEKKQGGETIPVGAPVGGTQKYKHDVSKTGKIPVNTPEHAPADSGKARTAVEDTSKKPPVPMNSKYPVKGVLKTAGFPMLLKKKGDEKKEEPKKDDKDKDDKEKQSAAVDFIKSKIAEYKGGGETFDSPSESGVTVPSDAKGGNDARKAIGSNKAAIDMKKVDGKAPQKRMLAEVLSEPAQKKSTDSKVQENLQNASKGGVKIAAAAARELLKKVAAEGCTCDSKGTCKHCKMQEAMKGSKEKASMGGSMTPMGGSPMSGTSTTPVTPST